jgi:hypothetical protein
MRLWPVLVFSLTVPAMASAQRIVEVPSGEVDVARPEDLYAREPGRWHLARQLWQGDEPCTATQCEAGFTSGDLAVSVERDGPAVTITASLRNCSSTAYSQLDIGDRASKGERKKITKQIGRVVEGLGKTCDLEMPEVAPLARDWLFPAIEGEDEDSAS